MKWSRLDPNNTNSYWKSPKQVVQKIPIRKVLVSSNRRNSLVVSETGSCYSLSSENTSSSVSGENNVFDHIHKQKISSSPGPKVQQYMFTQTQNSRKRSRIKEDDKCFICNDLTSFSLDGELVVRLKCDDIVHGECFRLIVTSSLDSMLPVCKGKYCQLENSNKRIVPQDTEIYEWAVSYLLAHSHNPSHSMGEFQNDSQSIACSNSNEYDQKSKSFFNTTMFNNNITRPKTPVQTSFSPFSSFQNIDPINSLEPDVDSLLRALTLTSINFPVEVNFEERRRTEEVLLKIAGLGANFQVSTRERGILRLADKLSVRANVGGRNIFQRECNCILFEKYLIIIVDIKSDFIIMPLNECQCYILDILRFQWKNTKEMNHNIVCLSSSSSQLVEKWAIAMTDRKFIFPLNLLTSTFGKLLSYGENETIVPIKLLEDENTRDTKLLSPFDNDFQDNVKMKNMEAENIELKNISRIYVDKMYAINGGNQSTSSSVYGDLMCLTEIYPEETLLAKALEKLDNWEEENEINDRKSVEGLSVGSSSATKLTLDLQKDVDSDLDSDIDSDIDSDVEKIDGYLKPRKEIQSWDGLIDSLEQAIIGMSIDKKETL